MNKKIDIYELVSYAIQKGYITMSEYLLIQRLMKKAKTVKEQQCVITVLSMLCDEDG